MAADEDPIGEQVEEVIESLMEQDCPELQALDDGEADEPNRDGSVEIHISPDKMFVLATFFPHLGSGKRQSAADIVSVLTEQGIDRSLIRKEVIDDALWNCEKNSSSLKDVEVARGIEPADGEEEHISLLLNPRQYIMAMNLIRRDLKKQNVNYRNFSRLCILEKNTPVAIKCDAIPGKNGINVKGEEIPCRIRQFETVRIGDNLVLNDSGDVLADRHGEFVYENGTISINEVLTLRKGVNYHTGNIHFPGAVEIFGEVEDGFKIQAGKDIHVHETLAASDILCGGNLTIHGGGIIGRKEHKVIVEERTEANFVERVHLESRKGILIKKEAYLSYLYTNGKVVFQPGGKLIGGETYSQNGLEVTDLGNDKNLKTEVYTGIDYKLMKMLIQIKSFRDSLLQLQAQKPSDEKLKFDEQILKCNLSMEYLLEHLDHDEQAQIIISGTVYPGTVIHICNARRTVTEEMKSGTFKLDKGKGIIDFIPF
ncbi:MAG: DUF342 domain-containing protein [Spirochaetales bacterium]|nr:DUF342 domain-containing protein [Spirochaetales bacterium]